MLAFQSPNEDDKRFQVGPRLLPNLEIDACRKKRGYIDSLLLLAKLFGGTGVFRLLEVPLGERLTA
jgi:hypothetical protein